MGMSSEKPIESAAEGATKGVLDFSEEKIKQLVERFRNRDIAFVEDPEIINIAKEQRKTSEWTLFKELIDDHDLHILFQLGLTLRKLERQRDRVSSLRDKIRDKYDIKGLHIAQLIQNGFFNRFLAIALERTPTPQQLKFEIKTLLDDIEKTVIFVKETENIDYTTQEIIVRIQANSPRTLMICASGYAQPKCNEIGEVMKKWIFERAISYEYELYETRFKTVFFLNKVS
jgi:hypothetical protein